MKIQINGFDIEINTEDTNMVVKVLDASGKELSNNTFAQSTDANASPDAVDMPSAEDTASTDNPDDTGSTDDIDGSQPPVDDVPNPGEGEAGENQEITDDEMAEGFCPSFEQFKKMNEAKKKKEAEAKKKIVKKDNEEAEEDENEKEIYKNRKAVVKKK